MKVIIDCVLSYFILCYLQGIQFIKLAVGEYTCISQRASALGTIYHVYILSVQILTLMNMLCGTLSLSHPAEFKDLLC